MVLYLHSHRYLHDMHKDNFTFHTDSQNTYKHKMLFYEEGYMSFMHLFEYIIKVECFYYRCLQI